MRWFLILGSLCLIGVVFGDIVAETNGDKTEEAGADGGADNQNPGSGAVEDEAEDHKEEAQEDLITDSAEMKTYTWTKQDVTYTSEGMACSPVMKKYPAKLVTQCAMHMKKMSGAKAFSFSAEKEECLVCSESDLTDPSTLKTMAGFEYFREDTFNIEQVSLINI